MNPALYAPTKIIESSGVACGDQMKLYVREDGDKLFLSFMGNSCNVAHKSAKKLEAASGQTAEIIKMELQRLEQRAKLYDGEDWIVALSNDDLACYLTPIILLKRYFTQKKPSDIGIYKSSLACDACVSMQYVQKKWQYENTSLTIKQVLREIKIDDSHEKRMEKIGLCTWNYSEEKDTKNFLHSVTNDEFKLIKKLRLAIPYYNKALTLKCELDDKITELAKKQILSLNMTSMEINNVNTFISNNNLRIYSVKGQATGKYYPANYKRTYMDHDYVAIKYIDAFKLISYLINDEHYKFVVDGSVPFSFKTVLSSDNSEVLTGHIHLEKIIQDSFQIIVDINIGAFPLGRTDAIKFDKKLDLEDLICITVSHLFKHEVAFIKDINDLYFLMQSSLLRIEELERKIKLYNLELEYGTSMNFLHNFMGVSLDYNINKSCQGKYAQDWPFSRHSHFRIKWMSMLENCRRKFGYTMGTEEAKRQLIGGVSKIPTQKYRHLCNKMNERVYLQPLIIFNRYMNLPQKACGNYDIVEESSILHSDGLYVTPIGIFFNIKESSNLFDTRLPQKVSNMLSLLELKEVDLNYDYLTSSREDLWLY